jgi:hypothetical protein
MVHIGNDCRQRTFAHTSSLGSEEPVIGLEMAVIGDDTNASRTAGPKGNSRISTPGFALRNTT